MLSSQTANRTSNTKIFVGNSTGKEDVHNAPVNETGEVQMGNFVTLVEQAILLPG